MKNTPRPTVLISTKDELNAWSHNFPLCFRQKIVINPSISKEVGALYLTTAGTIAPFPENNCPSDLAKTDVMNFPAMLQSLNDEHHACQLTLNENAMHTGPGCLKPGILKAKIGSAEVVALPAASSRIELTLDLVRALGSEELVIGALFHELAHFYRAHAATPIGHLNYFYELKDANSANQPLPAKAFEQETRLVRNKIQGNLVNKHKTNFLPENDLMMKNNLGFYTVEQEADELALEWLSDFGLHPSSMADGLMILGTEWEKSGTNTGHMPMSKCRELRKGGWLENGKPASVPVGDLSDAHHSPCFRIFNIDREIKAHAYKQTASPPMSLLSPSQFAALLN